MEFQERYRAVFSQIHASVEVRPEEFAEREKPCGVTKKLLLAGVMAALLASLCVTAYAANLFGLRDLLLPHRREVPSPIAPADGGQAGADKLQESPSLDVISLAGYAGTPESLATAEWREFLTSYDQDGRILEEVDNDIFAPGTSYMYYQVNTREMADKLDEIAARYGLKLHTDMLDDLYTDEALCAQVGGDFLGENRSGSAYMYEDGTFKFDGELDLAGYGHLDYEFMRCVRGSFTDILLNIGHVSGYREWRYSTASGVPVTLALASHKALLIANLPDSFVTVNILAGAGNGGSAFSSGPVTAEDLERFADSFDFSLLTPTLPADRSLPRPTLAEALGQYTPEEFFTIAGIGEPEAQRFYTEFFAAMECGDRQAVADMLLYPMAVTTGDGVYRVENPEEFLPYYDDIVTQGLWESISENRYTLERADLIPDNGSVGAANGAIWITGTQGGAMGVITIQNAEGRSARHISPDMPKETAEE